MKRLISSLVLLIAIFVIAFIQIDESSKKIDLLRKKNDTTSQFMINKVNSSNDIEFLRNTAVDYIQLNKTKRYQDNDSATFQIRLFLLHAVLLTILLVLTVFEIFTRLKKDDL